MDLANPYLLLLEDIHKVFRFDFAEENYGLYRASSRTHKRFLRQNHLGKFKKKK